jgi:phospholipid transport system substrate-binding protein
MKTLLAGFFWSFCFGSGLAGTPKRSAKLGDPGHHPAPRSAYRNETTRPEMRTRLIETIKGLFDATELSRRALAANWNKFSAQQQQRFTDAFLTLLQNTYLDRIESYSDEQVHYLDEKLLAENRAEVSTMVSGKGKEIPITYRMCNDGGWKVYDVVIEGVSLVQNYRNQFAQILMNQPPDALIDMLVKKS